jgi:hypothetical protein
MEVVLLGIVRKLLTRHGSPERPLVDRLVDSVAPLGHRRMRCNCRQGLARRACWRSFIGRAVRAGLGVIDAVGCLDVKSVELQARVGIATGLVVVGDLDLFGYRDLGLVEVKGIGAPVPLAGAASECRREPVRGIARVGANPACRPRRGDRPAAAKMGAGDTTVPNAKLPVAKNSCSRITSASSMTNTIVYPCQRHSCASTLIGRVK